MHETKKRRRRIRAVSDYDSSIIILKPYVLQEVGYIKYRAPLGRDKQFHTIVEKAPARDYYSPRWLELDLEENIAEGLSDGYPCTDYLDIS
jgi:hypothetical protein